MSTQILDPSGHSASAGTSDRTLAIRKDELTGLRVGLLNNGKRNAELLLDQIAEVLVRDYGVADVVRAQKTVFSMPIPEDMARELAATTDVVITGVGDCGSCSASAVADGIILEGAGVPAAVICSDAYRVTANAMATLKGVPDYRYATTAHPVAILDEDGVRARVPDILTQILPLLTGTRTTAGAA